MLPQTFSTLYEMFSKQLLNVADVEWMHMHISNISSFLLFSVFFSIFSVPRIFWSFTWLLVHIRLMFIKDQSVIAQNTADWFGLAGPD